MIKNYDLIKQAEGLRLKAYYDSVHVPTIGYGTTVYPNGNKVKIGDTCTQAQAEVYLQHDCEQFLKVLSKQPYWVKLTDEQQESCLSLCYNIGSGAFLKSTLHKRLLNV